MKCSHQRKKSAIVIRIFFPQLYLTSLPDSPPRSPEKMSLYIGKMCCILVLHTFGKKKEKKKKKKEMLSAFTINWLSHLNSIKLFMREIRQSELQSIRTYEHYWHLARVVLGFATLETVPPFIFIILNASVTFQHKTLFNRSMFNIGKDFVQIT